MSDAWKPTARVGPYLLVEQIGAGGMGEVWAAEDTRLHRRVALKRLLGEVAQVPEALARFRREARTQAALSSHHIAALYGLEQCGRDDGPDDVFIVMEHVEGQSLRDVLATGALDIDEAIQLFSQLALALSVAHRAGVVHRDLKPSNLILRPDGTLVVVDFGLAWQIDTPSGAEDDITTTGAIVGSVAYMSPQQAAGDRVGTEGDVWSAGVTLHEMLTGEQPFEGENSLERLAAILRDEPNPLRERRPDAPKALADLVGRCLKKDPLERPQTGDELLDLIPAIPLPITGRPTGMLEPELIARGTAHPPLSRAAQIAAVLAAIAGIVITLWCARMAWRGNDRWLSPAEGEGVATALLADLGVSERCQHRASGYAAADEGQSFFWMRCSPKPLHVTRKAPWLRSPPPSAGELLVLLTPQGRLLHFERWADDDPPAEHELRPLLEAAEIEGPVVFEPHTTDAWIRGAAVRRGQSTDGTPVFVARRDGDIMQFRCGELPPVMDGGRDPHNRPAMLLLIVVVCALAWVQRRRKRGDARGATTFGVVAACLELLTAAAAPQIWLFGGWREHFAHAALVGLGSMAAYYGFEPIVRRRWPGMLVGWERLVHWRSGEFMLGRELLLGCAATFPFAAVAAAHIALGAPDMPVRELMARSVSSPAHYVSVLFTAITSSLIMAATVLVLASLARPVVRLQRLAIPLACAVPALLIAVSALKPPWPLAIVTVAVLSLLLFRGGVVAVTTFGAANLVLWLTFSPMLAPWTLPYSVVSVALVLALIGWGAVLARRVPRVSTRSRVAAHKPPLGGAAAPPDTATEATTKVASGGGMEAKATETVQPDALPETVREGAASGSGEEPPDDAKNLGNGP